AARSWSSTRAMAARSSASPTPTATAGRSRSSRSVVKSRSFQWGIAAASAPDLGNPDSPWQVLGLQRSRYLHGGLRDGDHHRTALSGPRLRLLHGLLARPSPSPEGAPRRQ